MDRIKDYIKPIEVKIGGGFVARKGFNYSEYQQYAYDWLRRGDDWPLSNILENAKKQYRAVFGRDEQDHELFVRSIMTSLYREAAYLLFEKFLKDKLQSPVGISLGDPGISYSAYDLIDILRKHKPDNHLVYEIHDPGAFSAHEANDEFVRRSSPYYSSFMNRSAVDLRASCNISFATSINGIWYFAEEIGSNTYLGTGPTSVLDVRKHCTDNGISILYVEKKFEDWKNELLGNAKRDERNNKEATLDVITIYEEVNRKMKLVGNQLMRSLGTASKLSETMFRDFFLGGLSTHTGLWATGESENRKGRTDILVLDKRINERFIYEFKIYKQTKDIHDGLQQIIFQYPTQNDRHNGLVILSKKVTDFTKTMSLVKQRLEKAEIEIISLSSIAEDPATILLEYVHPRNSELVSMLSIFVFDFQH